MEIKGDACHAVAACRWQFERKTQHFIGGTSCVFCKGHMCQTHISLSLKNTFHERAKGIIDASSAVLERKLDEKIAALQNQLKQLQVNFRLFVDFVRFFYISLHRVKTNR